ncbi:hypothetical protein ACQE3D_08095 [Methylomonas sp. MS20]|uniref:hypothetical protein n=1 Tax=Methylomonas sp. MS20 TaxID=3418769 RepID=UPI003D057E7F
MAGNLFVSSALDNWHRRLNAQENVPQHGFRRNTTVYTLVCYVNNIIGCYLGHNTEPIPLFIQRGRVHMLQSPASEEWRPYYGLVSEYFEVMERHLQEHGISSVYE